MREPQSPGKRCSSRRWFKVSVASILLATLIFSVLFTALANILPYAHAQAPPGSAAIAPSHGWGTFIGTSGSVQIDVDRPGIAVRVEIPREFLEGVVSAENDTHFIQSNIRNDYYYYSVIDESAHWTYAWHGSLSDGPCFKPNFSVRDSNAPWCVEIWDFLNGTFLTFTPPKFIRFNGLNAPSIAGNYTFTLFIADHTNSIGYPDFIHAWNETLFVPVSMSNDPASIAGEICDGGGGGSTTVICPLQGTKGVAYAQNSNGQIVAKAYVNETTGQFNITGLYAAPSTGSTYQILASAGLNPAFGVAYSLTAAATGSVTVFPGENRPVGSTQVLLTRAPQLCGAIEYLGPNKSPQRSLSDNPSLLAAGLNELNVTVEATGSTQQVSPFRNQTISQDSSTDYFRIITGSNTTYVGTNPYGTEFAGLPPGPYLLSLNVHVSGYVQEPTDPFNVGASPVIPCDIHQPQRTIIMDMGGAISGTISLKNYQGLETPHQAEESLPLPSVTDALFGGNVLIEAYDHSGLLRAVSVINGTYPNGTTIYKDRSSIPFLLFGFSEYLNHTWSGPWGEEDNGLATDPGYSIRVYIRGYELQTSTSIPVNLGGSATNVSLTMLRGGAFKVGVFSYDNRFGTRATQSQLPFLFLNLSIPVPARTYFYSSGGLLVGYVECVLRVGVSQADRLCTMGTGRAGSEKNSFTVIFAGQNWSLREIWFYGSTPTHITNDTYTIKTYTLGYVWQHGPIQSQNDLVGFGQAAVSLLIGNEIDLTGPVFANPQLLGTIPENDHAIAQAFSSGLSGAVPANLTAGTPTLRLPNFGFGGMAESNGTLEGQGHFFYVNTDGARNFDYGLDNATYTVQVPEFGFNRHFLQPVPPETITFAGLFLQAGAIMNEFAMGRVITPPLVYGWTSSAAQSDFIFSVCRDCIPLSWVQVAGSNGTYQRTVSTLDGQFGGVGALNLPEGSYTITFSVAFYQTQTESVQVQWGGDSPSPLLVPLCPIGEDCSSRSSGSIALTQVSASVLVEAMVICFQQRSAETGVLLRGS